MEAKISIATLCFGSASTTGDQNMQGGDFRAGAEHLEIRDDGGADREGERYQLWTCCR